MKTSIVIISVLLISTLLPASAQKKDKEAGRILKEFSERTKALPGAESDFELKITDINENAESTINGSFLFKGEKYKLVMKDIEIYFNGKTIWNYIVEAEEVNIMTTPKEQDTDSFIENPVQFFSVYEKDFFYEYIGPDIIDGRQLYVIDLYPGDTERDFTRIRLMISKNNYELFSARYFGKNKIHYTIKILDFKVKELPDDIFAFNSSAHPEVEIIDLR